jgi:LCP family protein required for cell wall assembly
VRSFGARFLIALLIASVVTVGSVAAAEWYGEKKVKEIRPFDGAVDQTLDSEPDEPGDPANFLIVGSDTRGFVDTTEEQGQFGNEGETGPPKSDTIMIVHVDPASETGMVLSFPRDLWVNIPGRGEAKINAAFNDGIGKLIETIQANFDVPVHHALQVDFAGFKDMVDAIGNIPIYFPRPARDAKTHLDQPLAGCQPLEGDQALAYVRSREYEQYDQAEDDWDVDPRADIARIARQQYFIRTLAQTALKKSSRNPLALIRLVNETVPNLRRDRQLTYDDMQRLVSSFRDLDPTVVPMETVPYTAGRSSDGQSILNVDWERAEPILERMRTFSEPPPGDGAPGFRVPDIDPDEVSVRVLNGSGIGGVAANAYEGLAAQGFETVDVPSDAPTFDYETTEVRYEDGADDEALLVLLALGGRGSVVEVDDTGDAEVEVILGSDYEGVITLGESDPTATTSFGSTSSTSTTVPPVLGDLPQEMPLAGCPADS